MDKEWNIKIGGLNEAAKDFDKLSNSVDGSKKSMDNSKKTVGDYSSAIREASKEIKAIQGEMLGLEKGSKQWTTLAKKAGEYKDRIDDIREATKRYASDTKSLDDVINLAKSATAAFTLYKGAMSAFGMETEAAEEAIQKLAGAMSIIQSLQALQNALKGSSATASLLNTALKVTGAELITTQVNSIKATAAQEGLTVAQKAGTIATKTFSLALKAIPFMLVIGLIASLITYWEDIVGWIDKTFPALQKCGGAMNAMKGIVVGLGKAILNWLVNPWKTVFEVFNKALSGDFSGAVKAAMDGVKNQFKGTADAFKEGFQGQITKGLEEISNKTLEETNKQTKYQLDMLKARLGNEAKYSKDGIALQKKDFAERRKLAKGNKDELNKINIEEANFYRECQEHKAAAAKKSADERKRQEKAAADEAKRLAAEAEKQRKEEEKKRQEEQKALEEQRKKEIQAAKELANAKAKGVDLEIEYEEALIAEKKRRIEVDLDGNKKEISAIQDRIKALQQIANNENLTKKTRQAAVEQILVEERKLKQADNERIANLREIESLEKQIVELNKKKDSSDVINQLREQLDLTKLSEEEFNSMMAMTDADLKEIYKFDDAQVQHVRNAAKQIETIVQKAESAIASITTKADEDTTPTQTPTSGGGEKKKLSPNDPETSKDFWKQYTAAMTDTLLEGMNTISMFMDFAIEETERALEEVENLHDKALDKVNDSADKIKDLNDKLRDSSNTNIEATKQQLADEQLLYAQRLAEEQKLAEKERALKNKAAQQEASARKMELTTQMVMGIANTAQGVTKALATFAPPYSIIMAAAVGALGAIQTALIASQIAKVKPIKYAEGGVLQGKTHAEGGIPVGQTGIEVEGGEYVINRKSTVKYMDVLTKINNNDPSVRYLQGSKEVYVDTKIRKYADGGQMNFSMAEENLRAQQQSSRLIGAINDIDMQPIVSVVDIARVQDRLVRVRGLAGR